MAVALLAVSCGGAEDNDGDASVTAGPGGSSGAQSSGTGASTTATGTGASASTSSASGGSGGAPGAGGSGGEPGLATLGTLVVLGDSISDGGGVAPFYYQLLRADLEARYGAITYQNKAESGSKTGALLGQVGDLPASLPPPIAVVITSGGNDMKAAIGAILTGTDGAARTQMQSNIDAALAELLSADRFGPGADVHVFEGNIYDASDGAGDFGAHDCAFGDGLPTIPTDTYFDAWNGAIAAPVAARGQVLADMHAHFYNHGYAHPPSWYASDCTHPSALGHDQLRRLFYEKITGEPLP